MFAETVVGDALKKRKIACQIFHKPFAIIKNKTVATKELSMK